MITILPLGTGDAFSATRFSCCMAIGFEGRFVLVDCPHPVRKMLREASTPALSLDIGDIDAVILTHLHGDHASGLETWAWFNRFALQRKAKLVVHPDVARRLWDGHLAAGMEQLLDGDGHFHAVRFEDVFDVVALDDHRPIQVGPFEVECRATVHHIPTRALRIHAGGHSLGVSADTVFDPELIAWLAQSNLFVHEAGYGVHTPIDKLAGLAVEVRRKMRLTHLPDDLAIPEGLQILEQGKVIEVG